MGGRWEIVVAADAGMPCAVSPLNMDAGSLLARTATISEKKMPMESTDAEFMKVAIMPPAAPRWLAGTEFIISARLGETKIRTRNVAAVISEPPTVNAFAPNLSDRIPDS